jgi:hypothetical protein
MNDMSVALEVEQCTNLLKRSNYPSSMTTWKVHVYYSQLETGVHGVSQASGKDWKSTLLIVAEHFWNSWSSIF